MEQLRGILGECHAHMILDGIYFRDAIDQHKKGPVEAVVRGVLEQYRDAGVRYVRDGGDAYDVCLLASKLAPEYGIEYRMPVFAMHKKGRYGKIVGHPFEDMKEFDRMMRDAEKRGADFIKVMVSGILDFHEVGKLSCPSLEPETIREITDRVHDAGMAVMFHTNGPEAILPAIEAGADSLEHGFYMDEDCLAALGEHPATFWIPSISPVANQIGSGRFPDEVLREITRQQQENVKQVVRLGGSIALGSDAGAYLVPHVKGIRDELEYLTEALKESRTEDETVRMLEENERRIRERFRRG